MCFRTGSVLCCNAQVDCRADISGVGEGVRCRLNTEAFLVLPEKEIDVRGGCCAFGEGFARHGFTSRLEMAIRHERPVQQYDDGIVQRPEVL